MVEKKAESVLEKVKKDNVKFVQLQFTDLFGAVKEVTLPIQHLPESLEKGTWFDGSSIEGFARIQESDMYLKPDESTYSVLPFGNGAKVARLICDVFRPNGKPFEADPRYILKKTLEEAAKEGFIYNTGPELEFFLFKREAGKPTHFTHDFAGYFDLSTKDMASDIRREITIALESFGINVEMAHHEVADGQHEIDFRYAEALTTADRALTLKFVIKSVAQSHDIHASFMPKPVFGINGSGMHVHQSLFDSKTKKTAFYDSSTKYKLSKTALSFIAGQLKHARSFSAVTAPIVNSYKRLVPGYEAPVYVCWGQTNRSALIRVPSYSPGREQATRAELRCPDPSCNPYLAFAVMLKAGLDGIKNKLTPPEPVEEDVYEFNAEQLQKLGITTLPGSLNEAIGEFKKSSLMKEVFGEETFEKYIAAKNAEWDEYRISVTDWEKKKYFETI